MIKRKPLTNAEHCLPPIYLTLVCLFFSCGNSAQLQNPKAPITPNGKSQTGKQQAIATANAELMKTHDSTERFNVVVCETSRVWLIVYDGGGPEYVISKQSGLILSRKKIPQGMESNKPDNMAGQATDEQQAVKIAKKQADAEYGEVMQRYDVFACELSKAWDIVFEYREVSGELLPNSRSPFYVIDKKSGKVIHKEG